MSTAPAVAPAPEPLSVTGHVTLADGSPLSAAIVRAFDKDVRAEAALGQATSDATGLYEITYTAKQLARPAKEGADLVVRVFDAKGKQLGASAVLFNAPSVATVDIVIGADQHPLASEYEKLLQAIASAAPGIDPADFSADEITFLGGQTGADQEHLQLLVAAAQDTRATKVAVEVFYGLLRQDLPTDLLSLLSNSAQDLKQALQDSLAANIIPATLQAQLDTIVASLQQLLVAHALLPSTDKTAPSSLGDLLSTSTLTRAQQEKFVTYFKDMLQFLRYSGDNDKKKTPPQVPPSRRLTEYKRRRSSERSDLSESSDLWIAVWSAASDPV